MAAVSIQKSRDRLISAVTLNIDLNTALPGFESARTATPAHHRIMQHYASPFLLGPPPSDDLLEFILHLFTEDEADLGQHLPPLRPRTAQKVAARSGRPLHEVTRVLDHLAFTKRVLFVFGEPRKYTILPLLPGTFEMVLVTPDITSRNAWHQKFAELFERLWDRGHILLHYVSDRRPPIRYLPVNSISKTLSTAWPSDRLEEILEPYHNFAVGMCQCRLAMQLTGKGCGRPLENCVAIGPIAQAMIDNGKMRRADRQEILDIKRQAEEQGCVTFMGNKISDPRFGNISCSCCGCCCHGLRSITQFNAPGLISPPHFLPSLKPEFCKLCGKCVNICPMSAWTISDKMLRFDAIRCIGCGLCALACRWNALILRENDAAKPVQDTWVKFLLKQAPVYLNAAVRVWAKRLLGNDKDFM